MNDHEKRTLIDRYLDAYNSFDIDGMMATVHPDVEFANVSGGEINASASGAIAFQQMAMQSKELFVSRQQTVTAFSIAENTASIEVQYEAVVAVDLPNGLIKGETLRLSGRSEFEFRDGKLSRIVDYS